MSRAPVQRVPIAQQAKGRWQSILPKLGVEDRFLVNRHGPCPICAPGGGGTDRFRWDNKDGTGSFYCSQCGSGSGIDLVMKVNNWDFKTAAREIEKHVGSAPQIAIRQGPKPEDVKAEMAAIWKQARPIEVVEATTLYWMKRTGSVPVCDDLRGMDTGLKCPGEGAFPGMVAKVRDIEGRWVNLHRTYLTPDGMKASFEEPRRVMALGLPKGSAVRLAPHTDTLGVAEGLETAHSCHLLFGVPTWACLTAGNLKGWTPPAGVRRVVVFGDNDTSFTGQAAAFALANSLWMARQKLELQSVEVNINGIAFDPSQANRDWNDVLLAGLAEQGRARMSEHARGGV